MLSTRNLLIAIVFVLSAGLSNGALYCQEIIVPDTSDYISPSIDGALENNLMVAASRGLNNEIERLISKGADIDGESNEGATPLIFAVANNQLSSVKILLSHNPNIDKITSSGETPLIISVKNQNLNIAEVLIRGGAKIDLADKNGATALHYAAITGDFEMADMLLYYGADFNEKAIDGTTPLMAAIMAGYPDITDLLFQNGANLEARDNSGFTPFLIASQIGDTMIMNLLLKEGVDLYEKNNLNYNALALAIESNNRPTVEFLLEKGDKWTSSDKEGVNPYTVASAFGRKDFIELLEKKNISGRQGLRIDGISITASTKFNIREYFTGLSISFEEPLLNAGFFAGCDLKPTYSKVLLKSGENTFYQYFDKSSIVFAGLFKDFTLSEKSAGFKFNLSTSLSAGYNFGSEFKGTNLSLENKFRIIPSAGVKMERNHFAFRTDLEYMSSGFYHIGPLWLRFGISYNYLLSRVRSQVKTIKWN
jgi:ankyrin repeat protein